ncbi:MAG TPA: STAS domain-containing protein [Candidatus Kapabacteria bacterium]|jgi:anti-sigma B factor antagonist|nr:STAS domain-containing protein [Candidatus Kapabacteria bacterium]
MLLPKVRTSTESGVKVLALRGEFTGGDETDQLRNALAEESEGGTMSMLIDLEDATYLNSTALGVLIAAHTSFTKRGAHLGLCNVSKNIENLFVITKLVLVFNVYGSRQEGLAALGQSA